MDYVACPNCGSTYSGRNIWKCTKCGQRGCETKELFGSGSGCWNAETKNSSCCNSNYTHIGYIK